MESRDAGNFCRIQSSQYVYIILSSRKMSQKNKNHSRPNGSRFISLRTVYITCCTGKRRLGNTSCTAAADQSSAPNNPGGLTSRVYTNARVTKKKKKSPSGIIYYRIWIIDSPLESSGSSGVSDSNPYVCCYNVIIRVYRRYLYTHIYIGVPHKELWGLSDCACTMYYIILFFLSKIKKKDGTLRRLKARRLSKVIQNTFTR